MSLSSGFGNTPKKEKAGAPFAAGSANNGLSVDAVTGKIVLGNDVGGTTARLLSDREIPLNGKAIDFFGTIADLTINDNPSVPGVPFFTVSNNVGMLLDMLDGTPAPGQSIIRLRNDNTTDFAGLELQHIPDAVVTLSAQSLTSLYNSSIQLSNTISIEATAGQIGIKAGGFQSLEAINTSRLIQLGDVAGTNNQTTFSVDDTGRLITINAINGQVINGDTFTGGLHIRSNGSGTGSFANIDLSNNLGDTGELFLTASTYTLNPVIGARAIGFYNNGLGGVAVVSDNVAGSIRFSPGGSALVNILMTLKPGAPGTVNISGVQNFASNALALAGGLVIGDIYRTGGAVMIVI